MMGWAVTDWRRPRAWLPLGAALASALLCWGVRSHYFHAVPATWEPWPPSAASLEAGLRSLGDLVVRRPLVGIGLIVMLSTWVRGKFRIGRSTGFGWGLLVLAAFALLPGGGHDVERTVTILLAPAYLLAVESVWRGTRTRLGLVAALLLVGAQPARTWMARTTTPESRAGYAKLGEWLATHALPGTVVGARQVGALGYYSGLEMEDVLGQVSPRVAAARRATDGANAPHDFAPMLRQEPDLVLTAPQEPVPSAILYVPNLDAVPNALRSDYGVYRWAGSPVWRPGAVAAAAAPPPAAPSNGRPPSGGAAPAH
jgi:hypothetical protein